MIYRDFLTFRSFWPVLAWYEPNMILQGGFPQLFNLTWDQKNCQSIITKSAKYPQYSLTKSRVSAAVDLALKPILLDKLKTLYILEFYVFFDD